MSYKAEYFPSSSPLSSSSSSTSSGSYGGGVLASATQTHSDRGLAPAIDWFPWLDYVSWDERGTLLRSGTVESYDDTNWNALADSAPLERTGEDGASLSRVERGYRRHGGNHDDNG